MFLTLAEYRRADAARLAGVSISTLRRDLARSGLMVPDPRCRLSPDQVADIRQCGGSLRTTAARFGTSVGAVRKIRAGQTWHT